MFLPANGSEFYELKITAPGLAGWSASFDGGTTWVAGVQDGTDPTLYRWLLAGPGVGVPGSATVVPTEVRPQIKATGGGETIYRRAPYIVIGTPEVS